MKKFNFKNLVLVLLVFLVLSSVFSLNRLHKLSLDDTITNDWNDSQKRDSFLSRTDNLYLPVEALTFLLSAVMIYIVYRGWGEQLTDGKIPKIALYFGSGILGALYGVYNYMIIVQSKTQLVNHGKIIYIPMIAKHFLIMGLLFLVSEVVRKSILSDVKKEEEKNRGSDYYNKWVNMSEKVKKISEK